MLAVLLVGVPSDKSIISGGKIITSENIAVHVLLEVISDNVTDGVVLPLQSPVQPKNE